MRQLPSGNYRPLGAPVPEGIEYALPEPEDEPDTVKPFLLPAREFDARVAALQYNRFGQWSRAGAVARLLREEIEALPGGGGGGG